MSTADTIFQLSVHILLGISFLLMLVIGYLWYITKDKIIGIYGIYIVTCFGIAVVKQATIATGISHPNIMENTWPDEMMTAITGIAYIFFFGWVFGFNAGTKWPKHLWTITIAVMIFQVLYLVYAAVKDYDNYFDPVVTGILLVTITFCSLLLLVFAFLIKNKSRFQKMILAGAVVFYILVVIGNLSEFMVKTGSTGFNMLFVAFSVENIFFTLASAHRIRDIYKEAMQLKLGSYQQQLELEQVTNFFSHSISRQETIDDMLWDVSKNLIGKLGFEDCMIYLWNDDKTMLLQKAGYGLKGAMLTQADKNKYHIPKGKGITGAAADGKQSILVNDTTKDDRYFSADDSIRLSELSVPILHNDEVLGVINTEHSQKNFYTRWHLQTLTTVASLLAEKIEKIKAEQQAREKEIEVVTLNKDLAESQLTALRAQMNPHFIFNALNSVQQFILQGNITEANRYLSKFSKLQREVLNHSDKDFIPLEKELEVLNLYLELEQLRFDGNFTYNIITDENMDTDEIRIPPMIIQPFVENSIWHGLMPKQGDRWVHIRFEMITDDLMQCTVKDNGIGREAAGRLQKSNHPQHESRGLSLVYNRLQILHQQYGQAFNVAIHDTKDENNLPSGTEVQLNIYTG